MSEPAVQLKSCLPVKQTKYLIPELCSDIPIKLSTFIYEVLCVGALEANISKSNNIHTIAKPLKLLLKTIIYFLQLV